MKAAKNQKETEVQDEEEETEVGQDEEEQPFNEID